LEKKLSTVFGYGISLLLFTLGTIIPSSRSEEQQTPRLSEGVVQLALLEPLRVENTYLPQNPAEETRQAAQALTLPKLPPVDHKKGGKRRSVPRDPEMRCPQFEPIFKAYGLTPVKTWSYIAWRESRCRPGAQNATWDKNGNVTYMLNKNGTYDTGLLQINSSWRTVTINVCGKDAVENRMQGLKDLDCNLRVARYIMENSSGGLSNWSM